MLIIQYYNKYMQIIHAYGTCLSYMLKFIMYAYKAVSDGGVSNIRSLIHLVILQSLYRHTHIHTDT